MSPGADSSNDGAHRDPITGTPGAHPMGTGIGAALGGAAAGAATGFLAGPVGAAVGAVVGAVMGGLAGKDVAELIDPTREDAYWRENFSQRPYVERGANFEDYGPAYGFGVRSLGQYPGRAFDDVEPEMSRAWATHRGASSLEWDAARHAVRDAWHRVNGSTGRPESQKKPQGVQHVQRKFAKTASPQHRRAR